jgi:2-polyprenyl-6-methoxyphenol hydroxylase-like FAD-dependent oxidoreductase
MDIVWCKLPLAPCFESDPHMRAYLGGGHLLITAPEPSGRMQIAWIIAKGSYGEIRERGIPDYIDRMAAHVSPDLAAHFRRHREDAVQPFLLSTVSDRVDRWSRPGLLLIGDAAHTMSPVGAQGLNIAIRDAIVAANHLVPAFEEGGTPARFDEVLRNIEQERLPEVTHIQRLQSRPPRVILSDAWWSRLLLRAAPALLGLRGGRARAGLLSGSFAFGVSDVRLRV